MFRNIWAFGLISLLFWATVTACQEGSRVELTPTPPNTVEWMDESIEERATPLPLPTNTAVRPSPTFTLNPSPTPEPSPSVTPMKPVLLLTAQDFGSDRNPLTGEVVTDTANLDRRPIAVKISNSPAKYTRPQSGLSQADLVFEHVTEGPITRFTAVIYGQTPPNMGPIRSARLIDLEIPAMYDAALAYSGSSIGVSRKLFSSDFASRILRSHEPGYYRTGEDKPYEHTLYAHPAEFWPALEAKGENRAPNFITYMAFSSEPPPRGGSASRVTINYQNWTIIDWRYDPENGRYFRWVDGETHKDANNDEQISAANVVIILAIHELDTTICEFQSEDSCLVFSTLVHLWGEGPATLFRDGLQYEARWRRSDRGDLLSLVDENGLALPLQIGNTWFQVIPLYYPDPYSVES